MQLSQSLQLTKSSSTKLICSALAIAGITIGISQNRPEAFLIPLGIVSVAAGRIYVNTNKEKDNLRSQVSSLGSDLAYSLEIQQEQKFTLLELQEENTKLKNTSFQGEELSQQLKQKIEYLESALKSLSLQIQKEKLVSLEIQEENSKLKDASLKERKLIQQLDEEKNLLKNTVNCLQESNEYYEEEITHENQILSDQNTILKQSVEELKIKYELLQEEYDLLQQEKAKLLAERKAIDKFDNQISHTETSSIIDLDREREKRVVSIDLSSYKLAIVGGHPRVQNALIKDLKQEYNLGKAITVASDGKEKRITQQHIKDSLKNCDIIVMITGNLSSPIQKIVNNLDSKNHLNGDLLTVAISRGESGVLREIEKFLAIKCA